MKTLEEQALEYIDNNVFCDGITPFEIEIADKAFIAGANSKWVQAEKIKAQIDILSLLNDTHSLRINIMISKLKQQLKELQNE
jgi:hypothetical protein